MFAFNMVGGNCFPVISSRVLLCWLCLNMFQEFPCRLTSQVVDTSLLVVVEVIVFSSFVVTCFTLGFNIIICLGELAVILFILWFTFICFFFQVRCYIFKCFAPRWYQFHLFDLFGQPQLIVRWFCLICLANSFPSGHLQSSDPVGWNKPNILQTSACLQVHKYLQTQSRILGNLFIWIGYSNILDCVCK